MFVLRVDDELSLRLHDAYNVEGFFKLIDKNREHLGKWMAWEKNHQEVDDSYQYIMYERHQFARYESISTQIYYQGQVAGSCSLTLHDLRSGFGEIGYWLGKEFTGKGIVTRSVKAMVNFAFNTLNMHKIVLRVITGNEKSIAVAKRLGFEFEGIQVKQRLLRDRYYDYTVYYQLKENWQENTAPEFTFSVDEHIELRPLMKHHAEEIFATVDAHRSSLGQWMDWVDSHQSIEDTASFIKTTLQHYRDYDGLNAGIWYEGVFCGEVSFNSWSLKNYKADVGYWLADSFIGKGIMTKAVRALIHYGFDVVGIHRIELLCAIHNERSCAIAERLNFTHEGILRRGERVRNQYYDVNAYAILKTDWKA